MEDKIYGLIVQAQEMQKYALEFRGTAENAVKNLRSGIDDALERLTNASRNAVSEAARTLIASEAEKASRGLLDASKGAMAAAAELRGAQTGALIKHIFVLFLVAVVIGVVLYGGTRYFTSELNGLKAAVRKERATLAELQSKTWGLELGANSKSRWIVLPKGQNFGDTGDTQDGRRAIFIQ